MQKWAEKIFFTPTIGNGSLHQGSNNNGVRRVNFATSKNRVVKSKILPHRNIHTYNQTSSRGQNHQQIDHVLLDMRQYSSILDVRSFRKADFDTDHYLVIAKVRERLAVSKQAAQKVDGERFNLKKLNDPEVRKYYQIEITNIFAALENLSNGEDINRAWENIKEDIKTSDKECLGLH